MIDDALLAARLLAAHPRLGGIILRGDGPARDAVVAELGRLLPVRRMPVTIDDEALVGGRDLTATLAGVAGATRRGLLAEADGGLVLVRGAERTSESVAARLAAVLDTGVVLVERDGVAAVHNARVALVLLDDGIGEAAVPASLIERVAFSFDLSDVAAQTEGATGGQPEAGNADARSIEAIAEACLMLGIDSARAAQFALRVARATNVATAIRLVLAHRATRLPSSDTDDTSEPQDAPGDSERSQATDTLADVVLAAAKAVLPPEVLAALASGHGRAAAKSRGAGERRKSSTHGRPLGSRAGSPRGGARLALIDTIRAAAPWQRLRGRDGRIEIRTADIRITRHETRNGATTIVAVDASGSAAAARLSEAKGAVELLLAEAYVKRTEVALIAFRGTTAEVLLPPTRSLTRARRVLSDLPGGGGTPLGAGIDAARVTADAVRAKGRTPFVVLLSDGRGNVADAGVAPQTAAETAARAFGASGTASVFIDIAPRPRAEGATLAALMQARYLPLPRADATALHAAVKGAQA